MNLLYAKAKEQFLNGSLSWAGSPFKCVLVGTNAYSPAVNADQYLSDIPLAAQVAISGTLTGKTATSGALDADDILIPAVPAQPAHAIVIFQDTGTLITSRLVAFLDRGIGLPVTGQGGNVQITWSDSASRIVAI